MDSLPTVRAGDRVHCQEPGGPIAHGTVRAVYYSAASDGWYAKVDWDHGDVYYENVVQLMKEPAK